MTGKYKILLILLALLTAIWSCSTQKKIKRLQQEEEKVNIELAAAKEFAPPEIDIKRQKDTIKIVDINGEELLLMRTVVDESGEAVANQVLEAAVVTARFRHLAERSGKIDLEFQVIVPRHFQDKAWQLRYTPTMYIMSDTVKLEQIDLTGKYYHNRREWGKRRYELYKKYFATGSRFIVDYEAMGYFLQRFSPNSFYDDSEEGTFKLGLVGDTLLTDLAKDEKTVIDHYTNEEMGARNIWIMKEAENYFLLPEPDSPIRLDTVITTENNFVYNYVQTITPRPKLRKVDIVLDGEIWQNKKKIYDIPQSEPLTFYISSLSAFVDNTERYVMKVIERITSATDHYNIDFKQGKYDVDPNLGNNAQSINKVENQLRYLLHHDQFDLDSVVVVASASPEGSVASNAILSRHRSENISNFFNRFMDQQIDSLNKAEEGFNVLIGEDMSEQISQVAPKRQPIKFRSRSIPEDWDGLKKLVSADSSMTVTDKEDFFALCDVANLDTREVRMRKEKWYSYMKNELYPKLRTVEFKFILHRKGMIKDTIHTTVLDSVYMDGVQAIRDRDYELALKLLAPYQDYNTAIAYCAMDKNYSALSILENCEKTPQVNYMLAIIYSRFGEDEKAVQYYTIACQQDPQYVFRGNLDPEIAVLINRYGLNKRNDDEEF